MNKFFWSIFFALNCAAIILFAHMYRYEQIGLKGPGESFWMWDRLSQKACLVQFGVKDIYCSADQMAGSQEAQKMRAAGFSDKEIDEWLSKEKSSGSKK